MTKIDLYEDNGGTLWFVPEGEGIAIEMPGNGDFLTDARLYRDSWSPEDCPESVYPVAETWIDDPQSSHLATYRGATDTLEIHGVGGHGGMGHAAREYLRASLAPDPWASECQHPEARAIAPMAGKIVHGPLGKLIRVAYTCGECGQRGVEREMPYMGVREVGA